MLAMARSDSIVLKDETTSDTATDELTPKQAWCLYLSHFLSMWISRSYEFATILFIQHAFPGDLLPSSINGITETICVLVSAQALGRWVDQSPTRLRPLLLSILVNRSVLVICCALWLVVFSTIGETLPRILFALILSLGMVEKASRMSNTLSVERDWIPTIASYSESGSHSNQPSYHLTHLNTIIRRIDITCKFLAPLAISGIMIVLQPWLAAALLSLVGLLGCMIEIWSALYVWKSDRRLRRGKQGPSVRSSEASPASDPSPLSRLFRRFIGPLQIQFEGLKYWFSTKVWIPSTGTAILHASVLAWSGTLITWLLNSGYSYGDVTIAKSIGPIFEIGSTFMFPWLMAYLSRDSPGASRGTYQMISIKEEDDVEQREGIEQDPTASIQSYRDFGDLAPIITTAEWSIISLFACLVPTLIALFVLDATVNRTSFSHANEITEEKPKLSIFLVLPFLFFLSLSFLGRWTYDLSVTQLMQITIPARRRSEFGGTEMALVSLVSLVHWVTAAIWYRQQDFKWLALGSVLAVGGATGMYIYWARKRRRDDSLIPS